MWKKLLPVDEKHLTGVHLVVSFQLLDNKNFEQSGFTMAHHKSAKKRIRQTERRTDVNRSRMSRIRTFVKKVEAAIATGNATEAQAALKTAQPEIMRGVTKGVLAMGTASRKVSRLAKRVKALSAAA